MVEKVCLGCISEAVRCKMLIVFRDIVGGGGGDGADVQCQGVTFICPLILT